MHLGSYRIVFVAKWKINQRQYNSVRLPDNKTRNIQPWDLAKGSEYIPSIIKFTLLI